MFYMNVESFTKNNYLFGLCKKYKRMSCKKNTRGAVYREKIKPVGSSGGGCGGVKPVPFI